MNRRRNLKHFALVALLLLGVYLKATSHEVYLTYDYKIYITCVDQMTNTIGTVVFTALAMLVCLVTNGGTRHE